MHGLIELFNNIAQQFVALPWLETHGLVRSNGGNTRCCLRVASSARKYLVLALCTGKHWHLYVVILGSFVAVSYLTERLLLVNGGIWLATMEAA